MVNLTILLHVCAVFICIFWLAWRFRVTLVEVMPVFVCGLVLVLYVLAMLHHLSWIDGIAVLTFMLFGIWIARRKAEERREFIRICTDNLTHPSFIAAVLLLSVTALCVSAKVVTWWDDINFWATDVKALYFLDGFAGKYGNVAPEFGDYPPGAQLIKWWFLHLDSHAFREGLAFVGYYTMNLVFLLPLLRWLKGRNVFVLAGVSAALWLFPSIAEVYGYDGFCADLTMACIYGGFLLAVTEQEPEGNSFFYSVRPALYLGVLVLVKSIGFVWALFGLIFYFFYLKSKKARLRSLAAAAVLPILTGGSWMGFCLLMRRVTKTTATAVKYMTTDEYGISGYTREFAAAFLRAFVGSPLHKERSIVIDLTPLGLYLCICALVIFFYKKRILPEKTGRIVLWFSMVSGALFYVIIFIAHITIFATETQYLEASGMISSIERYGAPFTVGTLLFLAGIWLRGGERLFAESGSHTFIKKYGTYLCLILFIALTAGYQVGYHGLVGYRSDIDEQLSERAAMIGEDEKLFLETVKILKTVKILGAGESVRVCYIRRGDAPRWVNNSYTSYEASPVSVVYQSVNLDDAPTDWMVQQIRASHAAYLYAEDTEADVGAVFDKITTGEDFACGMLYYIEDDGTNMKLTRLSYR